MRFFMISSLIKKRKVNDKQETYQKELKELEKHAKASLKRDALEELEQNIKKDSS